MDSESGSLDIVGGRSSSRRRVFSRDNVNRRFRTIHPRIALIRAKSFRIKKGGGRHTRPDFSIHVGNNTLSVNILRSRKRIHGETLHLDTLEKAEES